jgi:hypothetical protein
VNRDNVTETTPVTPRAKGRHVAEPARVHARDVIVEARNATLDTTALVTVPDRLITTAHHIANLLAWVADHSSTVLRVLTSLPVHLL